MLLHPVQVAIFRSDLAFSEDYGDFTTNEVEELTGHPARSFETFAKDFAQVFAPASAPAS